MIGAILIWLLVIILFVVGLAGIILPFLPGIPSIFLGTFIYALFTDFREITTFYLFLFLGLTVISLGLDYFSSILGAKKYGASKYGIIGSLLGMLAGIFTLGVIGIIIGPFLGAVIFELLAGKKQEEALKVGFGTLIGFLAGSLFKFAIGLIMIGLFLYRVIF